MWDTSKDYRILISKKSQELFLSTVQTGSFRVNLNKKASIDEAKQMDSTFQSLSYCYLEGDELTNSPDVEELIMKATRIIEFLGGEEWSHQFLNGAPKEDKEKTEENVAKVRFFLNTIL